jgi:hypothetical protein
MIWHWLLHVLGVDNVAGSWYGWWSGAGSDIGEITLIAGVAAFLRHKNCHVHGCLRIGRHPVAGTTHTVCRRHHPDPAVREGLTAHHIHQRHREHLKQQEVSPP